MLCKVTDEHSQPCNDNSAEEGIGNGFRHYKTKSPLLRPWKRPTQRDATIDSRQGKCVQSHTVRYVKYFADPAGILDYL
jgi:hypothetical protein